MHRFFSASFTPDFQNLLIEDPDEVQHIVNVLRLTVGDEVEVINGRGLLARVQLTSVSKRGVEGEILESRQEERSGRPRIVLACAMPKRSKFDDILEKCTELGVDEVIPMITDRTEIAPSKDAIARMDSRMENIVINTCKQCKRLWFPVVHPVTRFQQIVDQFSKEKSSLFIPWLEGDRRALKDVVAPCLAANREGEVIIFFIGPEGDFTPAEAAYAIAKGAVPVSLGDTVLKVETAAITVVAFSRIVMSQ